MNSDSLALIFVAGYLFCLPIIGWLVKSKNNQVREYYLAGGSVGFLGLFFTLYATTYSGNTMLGFAGRAYRDGPVSLFAVLGMAAVIPVFMLFARELNELAKKKKFITIADFLRFRYHNPPLVYTVNLLLIITLASYVLTNLKAAGLLLEVISDGQIPMVYGIFGLATVMALYESMGGMRAVIWTDMLQGIMLLVGGLLVFFIVLFNFGDAGTINDRVSLYTTGWEALDNYQLTKGISLIFMFGIAIAIYPHALQRIFAAKDWSTLQKSFKWMCVMPLVTTLPIMLTAMAAVLILGDIQYLEGSESDRVIPILLQFLSQEFVFLKFILALFMAAALAAIMSTVDSALLSLGSMFTQDIVRPICPKISDSRLANVGRLMTWILMFIMAALAVSLSNTIWSLIVLKLEIMLQVAPSIILGVMLKELKWQAVLGGVVVGVVSTLCLKFSPQISLNLLGIHAGIWGLLINLSSIFFVQLLLSRKTK